MMNDEYKEFYFYGDLHECKSCTFQEYKLLRNIESNEYHDLDRGYLIYEGYFWIPKYIFNSVAEIISNEYE